MTNGHNEDISRDGRGRRGADQDHDQRETRVASREAACDARERDTALILQAAARRDTVAAQRDAAADRRDFDAAVHQWMRNQADMDPSRARTEARKDRVASKNDRRAADVDRTELASPPAVPRPSGVTLEEAIASAVERVKASSRRPTVSNECVRCRRAVPDPTSAEFAQWDPVGEDADSLICPDCLTQDEETTAAEQPAVFDADAITGTRIREPGRA